MENTSESDESQGPFEPIAIIGMSCILPDSPNIETLWKNILSKHVSFIDVPEHRWDPLDFFNEGGEENKTYSKIGAFVDGYEFDWRRWRQPPGTLPQIDVCQQWAVSVSASALEHAGYLGDGNLEPPRGKTSVIFANALGGENRNLSNQRVWAGRTLRLAKESGLQDEKTFLEEITKGLPKIDEDTMPGELANVVAGRVANLLDLQGPNYSTDAACASSMAAILDACRLLQLRQIDMAIAGASDRTMDPATYAKFSAIGALSATHSTPFDSRANGFVMGEGAGAIVLKRLVDAISDGDQIHAVIRGIGASSDGRGKGITAPSKRGQAQAVSRAYSQAGYSVDTVGLIEAHGTSTRVGDATELGTLNDIFSNLPSGQTVAVGSIKSQIGHLKAAAGIAGILKAILAVSNGIIPPSAGFETPNETVDWDENPFFVPMKSTEWESNLEHPYRAGVSAFGFGGTNFHIALESFDNELHSNISNQWNQRWLAYSGITIKSDNMTSMSSVSNLEPTLSWKQLKEIEGGVLLINASNLIELKSKISEAKSRFLVIGENFDDSPNGVRLSDELFRQSENFVCEGVRLALVATEWNGLFKKLELLLENIDDKDKWGFLTSQDIFIVENEIFGEGKIAHLFPGQGSQYVGMTYDLSLRYGIIGDTWKEADKTMVEILEGKKLSDFVLRTNLSKDEQIEAELKLKQTEYTQPSMLTADLALNRLLEQHGQIPDMVAGHSLGEYAALMVSGILQFHDALRAAAARGTEMGNVDVPDKGLMASITAPYDKIEEILYDIDDYVVPANKNSPLMTVIAGETDGVNKAIEKFEELGINCVILPTSHAFHTRIVAPANEPLKDFLENLELNIPKIPITSNYDGDFYPSKCEEGFSLKETILPQLTPQMSSPVEWTRQIENMYDDGATIFVEVGPKRALTMFCGQILEDSNYSALMTNHPKQGGIRSFLCALGQLAILGKNIDFPSLSDEIYTQAFRAGPLEATKIPDIVKSVEVSRPLEVLKSEQSVSTNEVLSQLPIGDWIANLCSEFSGYPSSVCKGNLSLSEDLGMSPTALEKLQIKISKEAVCKIPPDSATTISQLIDCIESIPTMAIKKKILKSNTNFVNNKLNETISDRQLDPYIVSGISLGLPGLDQVFQPDTFERIIAGENFITELSDEFKQRLLDKNLVRIVKDSSGNSELVACESFDMIPQLAGRGGYFDLAEQYGIDSKITSAMDISTKLAFAAGLEALRDAGLPLVADEQVSSNGKRLVRGWKLPVSEQNVTGVIFASVFPGFDELLKHSQNNGADENGTFDRRFLLQILSMGHSQFAQWIGAKGPNTAINNACASTPSAFSIAEDWITTGRATRVIVVSGDDTTSDTLLEWFGAGFTAAGAHSIGNVVEEVSLPFDVRRNGMLLGMGGAAFVIERNSASRERGVTPYCELLGAHIGNSAFHPTRLDVEHVSESFDEFMSKMELNWNIDRHEIAPKTTFMSHEPATPPRGGSAAAEINALRKAFGSSAEKLVITNTKGFTGHPMAVGIEDAVVIYGLTAGKLPPIANFKEPDSELGNLRLSKGGEYDLEYALRHAAGFGSQIALTLFKRIARTTNRIKQKMVINWIEHVTKDKIELRLFERKLVAWRNPDENIIGGIQGEKWELPEFDAELKTDSNVVLEQKIPEPVVKEVPKIVSKKEVITQPPVIDDEITKKVLDTVVEHTGYPADFIEFDQDLEGELGVDSVKQAEIMADLRAHFELPVDESFVLSEYPTLNHMIAYIGGPIDEHQTPSKEEPIENLIVTEVEVEKEIIVNGTFQINPEIRMAVVEVVVEHTGYPEDFIGFDQDLEGELGVDSVKQAEMMGDLRSKFNIPVDETFVLSEHPTLNHIAEYISKMSTDSIISLEEPPVETVEDDISETKSLETEIIVELKEYKDEEIHRWQVEVEEADELNSEEIDVSGRTILITDEDWNLGESIAEELDSRGAKVILLSLDSSAKEFLVEDKKGVPLIRANPTSENQLLEVAAHVTSIGNLGGIIHLAPLDLAGLEWTSKNSSIQSNISTSSLFNLLHELDSDFANVDEGIIVSVSAMDGRHGNRGSHFNPVAAGAHGIVKSYSKERPNLNCTALDIHPELISNTAQLAKHIVTESLSKQNLIEIGLDRDLRRWKLVLFDEALIHETTQLTSDDILLISGGGSGVTAASCVALASSCKDAKSTFVLLGRTELILETEGWINEDEEQIQQRKLELREKLIVENETVNMVQWENAWKPYVRSLDIHITINAIKSTGNEAIYYSCDVTDSKALNKIGKIIGKEFGPITSIIHGAGIEDSKLVGDKDSKVFEQVLSIKTNGWINLIQATSLSGTKNLKLACCFTSIAGRFGNAGQTDYSAANCILDAEMARLNATGNTRAIAIAWTGWREVGMATKGSIEKVFEQAGIQTVGLERGVKLFVDEILHKGKRRVVIAGELGVLDELDVKRDQPLLMPPEITSIIEDQGRICLIDYLLKFEEGKELTIETTFDVETYPFLVDHSIDGVPYLPGVMVLELFAECARLLMPESFVSGFNDVNFGLPVKLTKPEQKIRVIANLEGNNVTCSMESDLINSEGIVFGQPKKHHTAIVRLSKTYESSTKSLVESPQVGDIALSSNFIYSRFFHGPRFQCHGGIIRGISSNDNFGADGIVLQRHQLPNTEQFKLESENVEITLESYPMLIEAAFQNAGMVTMEKSDMQALPIGISSTTILRQPEKTAKLLIRTICRSISDGVSVHDAVIVEDSPKQPKVMLIEGIKLKALAPLDESMRFDLER